MAISIPIAADSRQFIGATKDMERGLEDVADSLDDLVKDSQRGTDRLEDGFKDASRSAEKVERSYKELADTARRETRDAGQATRKNIDDGADAAKASMDEVKSEAIANASETFSSFDGSATGLLDGIQGTFGGLVGSLGPLGMAVGAAAAIGVGYISTEFEKGEERAAAMKERVAELATEFIETGGIGQTSIGYIVDRLKQLAAETEEGKDNLSDLADAADVGRRPFEKLAQAFAGNVDGIDQMIAAERDYLEQLTDSQRLGETVSDERVKAQVKVIEALQSSKTAADEAAAADEAYARAGGSQLEAKGESIEAYRDSIVNSLGDAGESWEEFYDKATGALNIDKYIEAYAARVAGIERYNENLTAASKTLSSEALDYIRSLGVESAPLLDAYVNAPASKKAEIERIWAANGKAAADGYARELEANIPSEVKGPKVTLDTSGWATAVQNAVDIAISGVKNKKVVIPVEQQYTTSGRKVY